MVHKVIYGLRGWIAFAAFLDMGAAVQCYIDAESFLGLHLHASLSGEEHVSPAMARLLGSHRVLAALILTHCAFCIHHKPILSMAICSCTLTIITNYMETFYYQTAPLNFYTIFPVVIAVLTITGLCVAPSYLKPPEIEAEEETHMLRMGFPRKKNWNKKRP